MVNSVRVLVPRQDSFTFMEFVKYLTAFSVIQNEMKLSLQIMKLGSKNIFLIITIGLFISSCASNKPNGMRKARKKKCDCPSFGHLEPHQNQQTLWVINGQSSD